MKTIPKPAVVGTLAQNPLVCDSVTTTIIQHHADILEIRYDFYPTLSLLTIRNHFKQPLIFTLRSVEQEGKYSGSNEEKLHLFEEALQSGFDLIDCEDDYPLLHRLEHRSSQMMVSYHNFNETPQRLSQKVSTIIETYHPRYVKVVTQIRSYSDVLLLRTLIEQYPNTVIAFGMGAKADISRVMACSWGSPMIYGSLGDVIPNLEGPIPIHILNQVYRVKDITLDTKVIGLIGNPVKQSVGKYVHNYVFQHLNNDAVYLDCLVTDLKSEWDALKSLLYGASVTMPWKMEMSRILSQGTPSLPSINTILKINERWVTCNTDCLAIKNIVNNYFSALDSTEIYTSPKTVLICGSGGVAVAVASALYQYGYIVLLWSRTYENAVAMKSELEALINPYKLRPPICLLPTLNPGILRTVPIHVIVQATSVGFTSDDSLFKKEWLDPNWLIVETVHKEKDTQLVRDAEEVGCPVVKGDYFFINQAYYQYLAWFDQPLDPLEYQKSYEAVHTLRYPLSL